MAHCTCLGKYYGMMFLKLRGYWFCWKAKHCPVLVQWDQKVILYVKQILFVAD